MRIMKFGGATLADPESLAHVLREVTAAVRHEPVVVVVSAVGNTTDLLHDTRLDVEGRAEAIVREHAAPLAFFDDATRAERRRSIRARFTVAPSFDDAWFASGEVVASRLLAELLVDHGVEAVDVALDAVRVGDDDRIDVVATHDRFRELGVDAGNVLVAGGFGGRDALGSVRVLGRGGSDYVATSIAAALGARTVELWKDVDAIHESDPRDDASTLRVSHLTWEEADAFARSGVQILHPRTIEPLLGSSTVLRVRGIRTPWDPGTRIGRRVPTRTRQDPLGRIVVFGATGSVGTRLVDLLDADPLGRQVAWLVNRSGAVRPVPGESLADARARLRNGSPGATVEREELLRQLRHPRRPAWVVVDATASETVARQAAGALDHGHRVVTANKIGPSGAVASALLAARRSGRYAMETTVGAALPVLGLLDAVLASGDSITRIEAVLSGSVHAILGSLDAGKPWVESVEAARRAGLTEPDPCVDLRGDDVRRKLVILLRVAGLDVGVDDVAGDGVLGRDQTWDDLVDAAPAWEERAAAARARGERWVLVARFDEDGPRLSVESIERTHPLAARGAASNVIRLWTRDRADVPLEITGPGAGTTWTAAGLLRDLRSVVHEAPVSRREESHA